MRYRASRIALARASIFEILILIIPLCTAPEAPRQIVLLTHGAEEDIIFTYAFLPRRTVARNLSERNLNENMREAPVLLSLTLFPVPGGTLENTETANINYSCGTSTESVLRHR